MCSTIVQLISKIVFLYLIELASYIIIGIRITPNLTMTQIDLIIIIRLLNYKLDWLETLMIEPLQKRLKMSLIT